MVPSVPFPELIDIIGFYEEVAQAAVEQEADVQLVLRQRQPVVRRAFRRPRPLGRRLARRLVPLEQRFDVPPDHVHGGPLGPGGVFLLKTVDLTSHTAIIIAHDGLFPDPSPPPLPHVDERIAQPVLLQASPKTAKQTHLSFSPSYFVITAVPVLSGSTV